MVGLIVAVWLLAGSAKAQTPPWVQAAIDTNTLANASSQARAIAVDASGNVFVTGSFSGRAVFGSTALISAGGDDIFLAKYVPATNSWAWAVQGGGTNSDIGYGVAVSGNNVYVTGNIYNSQLNYSQVTFSGATTGNGLFPQFGIGTGVGSNELVLAAYTDNGTSATLKWIQVAGNTGDDVGYAVAASGSTVYVTGSVTAGMTNATTTILGQGTVVSNPVYQQGATFSASADLLVVAYTDNGSSATVKWTQVGGGQAADYGRGIAVSGNNVYVTGSIYNSLSNGNYVVFGGSGSLPGSAPQYGAAVGTTPDLLVAKYVDNGTSANLAWTQVAGGSGTDEGLGIAVRGSNVYVTGSVYNNTANQAGVQFGGAGLNPGSLAVTGATSIVTPDLILAKYTDLGYSAVPAWVQVGGGTNNDTGYSVVANGSQVYVAGKLYNTTTNGNQALFGGLNSTPGTTVVNGLGTNPGNDWLVAGYTDLGTTSVLNWTQVAGSNFSEQANALALNGSRLCVAGFVGPPAQFGSISLTTPLIQASYAVAALNGTGILAGTPAVASAILRLYPNPASGPATLSGATPGAAVHIFDVLGSHVATASADASGMASLPAGLAPGLYMVRAGASILRWVVE